MNGLSELSSALPGGSPFRTSQRGAEQVFPFPGNLAVGLIQSMLGSQAGGSESAGHRGYLCAAQPSRKPPHREGIVSEFLVSRRALWETGNKQLEAEVDALNTAYIFRNGTAITEFILSHRTVAAVLVNALPELRKSFGEDVVFNLEAISDDDESTSLYAIVVWRGPAEGAESALEDFDERWWLSQPAQSGLTFTYELA